MHSDHRRRYHVRPADNVYPGDHISTDQEAIDAVNGDRRADAAVDWQAIEDGAQFVRHRTRTRPTILRFTTDAGPLTRRTDDDVLVVRERNDGTAN